MDINKFIRELESESIGPDQNERFARKQGIVYLLRHMRRYPNLGRRELQYIVWLLGSSKKDLGMFFSDLTTARRKDSIDEALLEAGSDLDDYANALLKAINNIELSKRFKVNKFTKNCLIKKLKDLNCKRKSEIEKNVSALQRMFNLEDNEVELILFLFIISTYDPPEDLFDRNLRCDSLTGTKYLMNILGFSQSKISRTINKLENMGILHNGFHNFGLEEEIAILLQNPESKELSKQYFKRVSRSKIPLDYHFVNSNKLSYLRKLIHRKTASPTHILLYGPPGTGKSSMSYTLAVGTKEPVYTITRGESNKSENRRSAIIACLNMTNSGSGSIIIVDEADNLLNTMDSWTMRGETQDKGWLNDLMEKPGTRIIWITNRIGGIEDSVLRRFAYTLKFRPFSTRQRSLLFERILRSNRVKKFFTKADIEAFAKKYPVTAGPIELAIKKAKEIGAETNADFQRAVQYSLDSNLAVKTNSKTNKVNSLSDKSYSLEGLNMTENIDEVIEQLERFNNYRTREKKVKDGIAMLFHGPPGTGKTALGNYLGDRLDNEVIIRRYSDLQSMWVGQGEKNIRDAFAEATREEAILIIDEADSMLFGRDRAERSYEITFTNEFLTQMEIFKGILICTTNRLNDLDSAAIRRFTYKIGFDYLTPEGNLTFYQKLILPMLGTKLSIRDRRKLTTIKNLAPGDFKTVQKQFAYYPKYELSHKRLIGKLAEESLIKKEVTSNRRIGF
jgi:transitional endoplasmic reticulum ATPase